jgi:hypothetical protein
MGTPMTIIFLTIACAAVLSPLLYWEARHVAARLAVRLLCLWPNLDGLARSAQHLAISASTHSSADIFFGLTYLPSS